MIRIITISFALLLVSCGNDELLLPPGKEVLVVEGWVTDQLTTHWVKVSKSVGFNDPRPEAIIPDATLVIEDDQGQTYPLTFDEDDGRYFTSVFSATDGLSYRLHIVLANGDEVISKWDPLNQVPPIDDIFFNFFEDTDPVTGENINVYYPIVTSNDPILESNQYRYKGYRNGRLLNSPTELILLSDEFNNGQSLPHHIPEFRLAVNDEIEVELHSLSLPAFRFLELLKAQTTSLGSSSGTAPAKLIGNLSYVNKENSIVLGFFGASSIQSATAQVSQ